MICGWDDWLCELEEDFVNYLVKEIYKGKIYVLNLFVDRK